MPYDFSVEARRRALPRTAHAAEHAPLLKYSTNF